MGLMSQYAKINSSSGLMAKYANPTQTSVQTIQPDTQEKADEQDLSAYLKAKKLAKNAADREAYASNAAAYKSSLKGTGLTGSQLLAQSSPLAVKVTGGNQPLKLASGKVIPAVTNPIVQKSAAPTQIEQLQESTDQAKANKAAQNIANDWLLRYATSAAQVPFEMIGNTDSDNYKVLKSTGEKAQQINPINGIQNPSMWGKIGGNALLIAPQLLTGGGAESTAEKSLIQRLAINTAKNQAMQTAYQALPLIANDAKHGESVNQIATDLAKQQVNMLPYSAGFAGIGEGLSAIPKLKSALVKSVSQGVEKEAPTVKANFKAPNAEPDLNLGIVPGASKGARIVSTDDQGINTIGKIVSGKPTTAKKIQTAITPTAGRPKGIISDIYQRTVDVLNPIKALDKSVGNTSGSNSTYIAASNAANAGGISNHILTEGLVTKEGKTIGESFKSVSSQIPKSKEQYFEDYLLNKHNISRSGIEENARQNLNQFEAANQGMAQMAKTQVEDMAKSGDKDAIKYLDLIDQYDKAENKDVFKSDVNGKPVDAAASAQKVADYEKKYPQFKQASQNLQKWWQSFVDEWGVKTGMIDKETQALLKERYPDYVPTYRQFKDIERASGVKGAPSKFVNQPGILKKATGSDRPVISPLESFTQLVQKMVKAAKYNEVGQRLYQQLEKYPDELRSFAEILPDRTKFNLGDDLENNTDELLQQWQKAMSDRTKNNVVRVMIDGKPKYIQINDSALLRAVDGMGGRPQADNLVAKGFRKTGNLYKSLITGKNPLFALKNIARDVPTYLINSTENNPIKSIGNLGRSVKGVLTNSPEYQEYKALGGGEGGFFNQDYGALTGRESIPKRLIGGIEKFNNATEQTPRFAEYLNTKGKLGDSYGAKQQALFNANDVTTNFARHGDVTKSADAYVPYLNPGVQGLDKVIRQVVQHPIGTLAKGVLYVTLPTLALNAINANNPNYQALDNRTKDNYYLIPNVTDGGKTFIKIPKSREFGVLFGSLVERITRAASGQKNAFQGFANTAATNIAPNNPLDNNLLSPIVTNIPSNKDFAGRPIVPASLQNLSPKYQYDEKTSELAKSIGNKFNLSPKQIDYLINSYFGVAAQMGLPLLVKSNYSNGNAVNGLTKSVTTQFTANPLYSNQDLQDFYNNLSKAKTTSADKAFSGQNNYAEKDTYSYLSDAQTKMSAIQKQINNLNPTKDALSIAVLRQQMVNIAKDANNYMNGARTDSQSVQSALNQYNYAKSDNSKAAKEDVTQAIQSGSNVSVQEIVNKYGLTPQNAKTLITNAKKGIKSSQYSDVVKSYLNMSKVNRKSFYNSLSGTEKSALTAELNKYGLNP